MSGTRAESCAGDRALHRAALALRSAGLWICAWLSLVSCSWPPSIVVVVPSIPAGSATLSVLVSSAGKQATEMPRLDVAAFAGQAYRFGVHPPLGSVGVFSVAIAAYDKGGCLINATSGDIELTAADNDGFVYGRPERDLQLPLDAAPMEYAASCHNGVPTIRSFVQDEDDPTLVIITGWGFAPGITAQLDGVALTNVVRKDATRLEARLTMIASPSGLRGGSLLLTNPDGKTATLQVSVYGVSFAPRSKNSYPLDTALEPVAVAVADINKDDLPDVVVSGLRNTSAGFLGVYLNQGGGKYPAKPDVLELPNTGDDLAILDVNQDGHLDVAVISTMGGQLLVALNDGTGHYNPGQTQLVALPLGFVPIVVEDLGIITPDVVELRQQLGLQGMKVLQFAFDGDPDNAYLPHTYGSDCVVYTGTHDNQTTIGWFQSCNEIERQQIQTYIGADGSDIAWDFIRLAFESVADLAIIPLQDVMRLGDDARMNRPGIAFGNWKWRYLSHQLNDGLARGLRELAGAYGRLERPAIERGYDPFDYSAPDTAHPLYDRHDSTGVK